MDERNHPRKPPIVRFMALTQVNRGSCWLWLGSKSKDGYGQFILDGRRDRKRVRVAPYRFIWEYINGPMGEGLEPDHTCNNRNCVNPEHIEPVTHSINQKRSYQRGRRTSGVATRPKAAGITHCPQGHEYTQSNSRITSRGTRVCKECDRIRCRAYQAKRKTLM